MEQERIPLSDQDVAYLVGRSGARRNRRPRQLVLPWRTHTNVDAPLLPTTGQTRMRLERFSGARLNIDRDVAEVEGTAEERSLAKLAISITLQQRNGGAVTTNFDELEDRTDVSTFDVPKETVGFLLGAKGQTLRAMETNHKVFMFFNNDQIRQGKSVRRAQSSPAPLLARFPP